MMTHRKCVTEWCNNPAALRDAWCYACALDGLADNKPGRGGMAMLTEHRLTYEIKCYLCSRGYDVVLTKGEQRKLACGNKRCEHCGGGMWVEQADTGNIGSAAGSRLGLNR